MGRKALFWTVAAVTAAACSEVNPSEPEGLGPEAAAYLTVALDIMQSNSIRRHGIDWAEFRQSTMADAGIAKTPAETHEAIGRAIGRIGDNHSFFQPPGDARDPATRPRGAANPSVEPTVALIEPGIGYVDVPAYAGGGDEGDGLAVLYHRLIEQVDATGVCGWVVDVRGNTGGSMWPMLAGLGPILGEGLAGFFVDPDSEVSAWSYEDGSMGIDGTILSRAAPSYAPRGPVPAVALLTDGQTASSGEAVAVAFRRRADTRSFGTPTFGVSTANAGFGLPDGAVIFLTVAWMADRSGQVHGGVLTPDDVVAGTKTGERATDAALAAALDWMEATHCR